MFIYFIFFLKKNLPDMGYTDLYLKKKHTHYSHLLLKHLFIYYFYYFTILFTFSYIYLFIHLFICYIYLFIYLFVILIYFIDLFDLFTLVPFNRLQFLPLLIFILLSNLPYYSYSTLTKQQIIPLIQRLLWPKQM